MTGHACPAAYLHAGAGDTGPAARQAATTAARLGWPAPAVYLDNDADLAAGHAPALAALAAAIETGRHDALLVTGRAAATIAATARLMRLLMRCTRNGVTVSVQLPPATGTPARQGTARP